MVKCAICNNKIEETFLNKIIGAYINKKPVCRGCQTSLKIEELIEKTK